MPETPREQKKSLLLPGLALALATAAVAVALWHRSPSEPPASNVDPLFLPLDQKKSR